MAAAASPSADLVGNSFIGQFYNVLHQTPSSVHRFYTDESKLSRDFGLGVEVVTTQDRIHEKIMTIDWVNYKAEIKTVDSQNSLAGGVMVLVTGTLSPKSGGGRDFVETFFLAPQEKGYFVLNDAFRYVDEPASTASKPQTYGNGVDESLPEADEQLETEEPVEDLDAEPFVVTEEPPAEAEDELLAEPQVIEEPVVEAVPEEAPAPPAEELHGEPVKKSYATIVSLLRQGGGGFQPRPAPVKPAPQPVAAAAPVAPQETTAAAEEASADAEGDKRSVYVKFLPVNVTDQQLEAEFKKFGSLKPGGIQIRTQKQQNGCYAFVEFEDAQSAANAIQGSGLQMNGRSVVIEEKKPGPRRFQSDRGFQPDRSSGGRGRGYYSGGGGRGFGDREGGGLREGSGSGRGFGRRTEISEEGGFRRYDSQRNQRRGPLPAGGSGGGGGNGSNRNGRAAAE